MQPRRDNEEKTEATRLIGFIQEKQGLLTEENADAVVKDLIEKLHPIMVRNKRLIEEIVQALRIFDSVLDDTVSLPNVNIEHDVQRRMRGLINNFERQMYVQPAVEKTRLSSLWSAHARKAPSEELADTKVVLAGRSNRFSGG
jgi:hypothetical protein